MKQKKLDVDGHAVGVYMHDDGSLSIACLTRDGWACGGCNQYLWSGNMGLLDRICNPRRWFRSEEQQMWVLIRRCVAIHRCRCANPNANTAWESLK